MGFIYFSSILTAALLQIDINIVSRQRSFSVMKLEPHRIIASSGTSTRLMSIKGFNAISNSELMGGPVSKTPFSKAENRNHDISCVTKISADAISPTQHRNSKIVSKRLSKKILSCGSNFQAALSLLYQSYPQLEELKPPHENDSNHDINLEKSCNPESLAMDPRVISTTIDLLRRANQPKVAFELIDRVLNIYRLCRRTSLLSENAETSISTDFDLCMIFKSMMSVLGHTHASTTENNPALILQILHDEIPKYNEHPPPMDIYHATINALGRCKRMDLVQVLLQDMESSRTKIVKNNSCGSMGTPWEYNFPIPDRLAYLTAITASIRSKQPHYALNILRKMKEIEMCPDIISYNQVLASLAKSGGLHQNRVIERHIVALEILNEIEDSDTLSPNKATYDIVISICGKDGKWDMVSQLTDRQKKNSNNDAIIDEVSSPIDSKDGKTMGRNTSQFQTSEYLATAYKMDLEKIEKVGQGRMAWYKFGHYSYTDKSVVENSIAFGFGIQMHRNPRRNGISVVFYEELTQKKLGYMLLRNTLISAGDITSQPQGNSTSEDLNSEPQFYTSLLGLYITEDQRGKGLANIFIAVWLQLCVRTNTLPRSEKINKPLLSLVLSKFGFQPDEDSSGVDVEVSPISHVNIMPEEGRLSGWKPVFAVYSPSLQPLDGSFGERDLRVQKMAISRVPPNPRGKVTRVKTTFTHPITQLALRDLEEGDKTGLRMHLDPDEVKQQFEDKVNEVLRGRNQCGNLEFGISDNLLNHALFGFCLSNESHDN